MYGFMQRNGKKLLAVIGAALMIVFILPPSMMRGGSGPGDQPVGKINAPGMDKPVTVTVDDLQSAAGQFQMLSKIVTVRGQQVLPLPFSQLEGRFARDQYLALQAATGGQLPPQYLQQRAQQVAGEQAGAIYQALSQDKTAYWLLLNEADRAAAGATDEQVDAALDGAVFRTDTGVVPIPELPDQTRRQVRGAVANFLAVVQRYDRAQDVVRVSRPLTNYYLARQFQQLDLALVSFDAAEFEPKVPEPTGAQLEAYFKAHADVEPNRPSKENPFGVGYRVPPTVKYQYLAIPRPAVVAAVRAEKSDYDWEVLARKYFLEHPDEFAVPPEKEPASQPTSGPATEPATEPATRPFDRVRQAALDAVIGPVADQRAKAVVNLVRQRIKANADPSFAALQSVAAEVRKKFDVTLDAVDRTAVPQTAEQLAGEPGLGRATATLGPDRAAAPTPFAEYVMANAAPLAAADPTNTASADALPMLRPSEPLENPSAPAGDTTYVVRLTAADPAHPPADLATVKAQVGRDWRRAQAFDLAKAAADALIAESGKADKSALSAAATGPVIDAGPLAFGSPLPPALNLPPASARDFYTGAYALLSAPGDGEKPLGRIDLPAADRVLAAQVTRILPSWSTDAEKQELAAATAAQIRQQLALSTAADPAKAWFSPDAIVARTGYAPTANNNPPAGGPSTPAPTAPRIGS